MDTEGVEERVRRTREELRRLRTGSRRPRQRLRAADLLAIGQGAYYFGTGLWPILHMPSFLAVTGPKRDLWLVRTVGALIAVLGGTLMIAGRARRITPELRAMAVGGAAALTFVDVIYVARRTIPPVYLLDAATEVALIGIWGSVARRRRSGGPRSMRRAL